MTDPTLPAGSTDELSRDEIRAIAYSFQKSRILLTAYELKLFSTLGDRWCTSEEVAGSLGTARRATDRLMNALCSMGLLMKRQGLFANTPSSRKFLVEGSPAFMAGLLHTAHLWNSWSTLTDAVREGKSVLRRNDHRRAEEWLVAFIAAMHDRASAQAPTIIRTLDLSGVSRVLDVGGGSGAFAMAFVQSGNAMTATVFDLPEVLPLTMTYVERQGLAGRVQFVAGDYLTDDLGTGFDVVFLSAIIHSNTPEENAGLIAKCARALRSGGRVIVLDFIMDEDRVAPSHGSIFALNMLVGTHGGDTYTEAEVRRWMEDAGLSGILRSETPYGTTEIIGHRA